MVLSNFGEKGTEAKQIDGRRTRGLFTPLHFPGQALSLGEEEEEERGKTSPTKKNEIGCAFQRLLSSKPKSLCDLDASVWCQPPAPLTPFCKAVEWAERGASACLLLSSRALASPCFSSHRIGYRRTDKHETTASRFKTPLFLLHGLALNFCLA